MSIVGSYLLHLYCDGIDCKRGDMGRLARAEFSAQTAAQCFSQAKKAGWGLSRGAHDLALCPGCLREERREARARAAEPREKAGQ